MQKLTIGEKVKAFRLSTGLSQLDLELRIDASPGSISRIESGVTNPTKETILRIVEALNLRPIEFSYLIGALPDDPTEHDVEAAIETTKSMLDSYLSISFLLDHQSRLVKLSKGFVTLLKYSGIDTDICIGKNIMELIFDPQYGIRNFIDKSDVDRISDITIAILKQEKSYLFNEPWWNKLIQRLSKLPQFERSWENNQNKEIPIYSQQSRRVTINVKGLRCTMAYAQMHLYSDPRFSILEYTPQNRALNLLLKTLSGNPKNRR